MTMAGFGGIIEVEEVSVCKIFLSFIILAQSASQSVSQSVCYTGRQALIVTCVHALRGCYMHTHIHAAFAIAPQEHCGRRKKNAI